MLTVDGADIADILCSPSEPASHGNSVVAFLELGRGTFDRDQTGCAISSMRCQGADRVRTARRYGKQIFLSVDVTEYSGVTLEVEKAVFRTVGDLESKDSGM